MPWIGRSYTYRQLTLWRALDWVPQDGQLQPPTPVAETSYWASVHSTPRTLRPITGVRMCYVCIALGAKPQLIRQPQRCTEDQAVPDYGKPTP